MDHFYANCSTRISVVNVNIEEAIYKAISVFLKMILVIRTV